MVPLHTVPTSRFPSAAKRARRGTLVSEDLAVAPYRMISFDEATGTYCISTTPLHIETISMEEDAVLLAGSIVSPQHFELNTLEGIQSWKVYDNFVLALRRSAASPSEGGEDHEARIPGVLSALVTAKQGMLEVDLEDPDAQDDIDLLEDLKDAGYVNQLGGDGEVKKWQLTREGRELVEAGLVLSEPAPMLTPRALPFDELTA